MEVKVEELSQERKNEIAFFLFMETVKLKKISLTWESFEEVVTEITAVLKEHGVEEREVRALLEYAVKKHVADMFHN